MVRCSGTYIPLMRDESMILYMLCGRKSTNSEFVTIFLYEFLIHYHDDCEYKLKSRMFKKEEVVGVSRIDYSESGRVLLDPRMTKGCWVARQVVLPSNFLVVSRPI